MAGIQDYTQAWTDTARGQARQTIRTDWDVCSECGKGRTVTSKKLTETQVKTLLAGKTYGEMALRLLWQLPQHLIQEILKRGGHRVDRMGDEQREAADSQHLTTGERHICGNGGGGLLDDGEVQHPIPHHQPNPADPEGLSHQTKQSPFGPVHPVHVTVPPL